MISNINVKIRRKWNYKYIIIEDSSLENLGMMTDDGTYKYAMYLGCIDLHKTKFLPNTVNVLLEVHEYTFESGIFLSEWIKVDDNKHLLGAFVGTGVFIVLSDGKPIEI